LKSGTTGWKDPSNLFRSMDERPTVWAWVLASNALGALEKAYELGLSVYLRLEHIGIRKRLSLPIPVISIGNLSVGGTGKTPATIAIATALKELGLNVVVLSRGHGGTSSKYGAVVSDDCGNILLSTAQSGDEPMVLAMAMPGIPVLVGKDRRLTALTAITRFHPDVLVLDDGFQYWQLKRDVDIVLLDSQNPFGNGHALPRGLLREPKKNLSRAQIVLLTRSSHLTPIEKENIIGQIDALTGGVSVYYSDHVGAHIVASNAAALNIGLPIDVLAVCAIAKPLSFLETVRGSGIDPVETLLLPDHHHYGPTDRLSIIRLMKKCGAKTVVTTQKDYVKLASLLPDVPLFVQPIAMEFHDESRLITELLRRVGLPCSLNEQSGQPC
jgi:tetraacyldisaccharide 4'-kinase